MPTAQPLLWAATGKGWVNFSEHQVPTTNKGGVITEGKVGEPADRARHHFFQRLETALAEYLPWELVATQELIKGCFPTTWSGCCCVFLTAVSSSDFCLCGTRGLHTSKQGNSAHKVSKEEIQLVPAFGQGFLAQGGQSAFPGAVSNSSRMVALGEYPQADEAQYYLASTRVLQTISEWSTGRDDHPAMGWPAAPYEGGYIPHRAVLWGKDAVLQLPQGVCFHTYTDVSKRRDKVLAPPMSVRKTNPPEAKGRNLHSFILLSPCSHTNLSTCFLFYLVPTVTAPFLGVDTAAQQPTLRGCNPPYVSDSLRSPPPFARLSQLDILVTVFWKQRMGCI